MISIAQRRADLIALAALFALAIAMFSDLLFTGGTRVVGYQITDLYLQFLPWRDFGFRELARGNLALWNPYIFGGAPYFGAMQGALLYPPNWLFLVLPLAPAVNWTTALHVFAIGAFTFGWMRVRRLHVLAGFLAGVMIMFGGAHFLHIFAGHLPHLLAMTWAPLIFCAIDGLFEQRKAGWCFLGIFAVGMQVLAGFPQHVFYTAIIAGIYSALRLIKQRRWLLIAPLLGIYIGGAVLSAVQLLAANQTMRETIRGVPLPFVFASQLPFPPQNLLTLLVPDFFGQAATYWGRSYLWESCLFVGVVGILLAVYAVIYCDWKTKWIPLVIFMVAFVLALGVHTPLYRVLYEYVPGFDKFRSVSKFIFTASLFLALLAAIGFDRLLQCRRVEFTFTTGAFFVSALLVCTLLWTIKTSGWRIFMDRIHSPAESFLSAQLYASQQFAFYSQHRSAVSVGTAALVCALFATLLAVSKWKEQMLYGIALLASVEMFWFAHQARPSFDSKSVTNADEASFLQTHPGDYRILNPFNPNSAMSIRVPEFWGYDASVVRRYAEFVAWTQGANPDAATQDVKFHRTDPLYAMLRLRYAVQPQLGNFQVLEVETPPLPHALLISKYKIAHSRDEIFYAMRSTDFDPSTELILEADPKPAPLPPEAPVLSGTPGQVKIISESTDHLTIEADTAQPAILLVTDVFTASWRAVSLPGSSQRNYNLQPANYVLRSVPLAAGHHRLRLEYFSPEFEIGKWVSLVSAILFVAATYRFRRSTL